MHLSRRALLRGGAGIPAAAGLGAALASCGVPSAYIPARERAARDRSAADRHVNFSNWPMYIDVDDKDPNRRPTLDAFTRRTGITVTYTEEINDNDEFFGKISPALQNHQPTGRDIVVFSDWMASRVVRLGWVQELDHRRLPNAMKHLDPQLRRPPFDPGRRFSLPWQSGITGIAYNRKLLGTEFRSMKQLWAPELKGKVTLFAGMDEASALLMLGQGIDPARFTADQYLEMCEFLQRMVDRHHIRRFTGNDYTKDLASGDVVACQAYSGDVVQLAADNPHIEFAVPEEGAELWSDNSMVPNLAAHKADAEQLIDFYYRPEAAAALAAWVNYICPVPAAQHVLASSKDRDTAKLAENPLIFPTAAMRKKLVIQRSITARERPGFEKRWNRIVGL